MYACTDIYRHIYRHIYTSTPLNHFALQLKLTEDSKSTIPQVLKKKKMKGWGEHTQNLTKFSHTASYWPSDICRYSQQSGHWKNNCTPLQTFGKDPPTFVQGGYF